MTNYAPRREANELSRSKATAHHELWEEFEIELLEEGWEDDESTLPEVAELLGRTIEACRQKHYDLRKAQETRGREARRKSHHNSQWDRGWSSLEDMGF